MDEFLSAFLDWCLSLMSLWQIVDISVAGFTVNLFAIILGSILLGFVITVFWKGARG